MKRLIALIIVICMMPAVGIMAADATQLKTLADTWYVYDTDDFESLDISTGSSLWDVDGWTPQARPSTKTMDSTLQEDPINSQNKVMRIQRTVKNTSANERIYKSFENDGQAIKATGDVKVSFSFLEEDALNRNLAFSLKTSSDSGDYGGGAPGDRIIYLYFGDGKVREDNGTQVATYPQDGSWVNVDIILNTTLKQFDLYINGTKATQSPLAFFKTDSNPMDIARICFNIDRSINELTTKYIDDISISLLTPLAQPQTLKTLSDTWHDWHTDTFEDLAITVPTEDSIWGVDGWTPQAQPNPRTMDTKLWQDPNNSSNMVMQIKRTAKNTSANERIYKSFERNGETIKATGDIKASFRFLETDGANKNLTFSLRTSNASGDYGGGAPGDRIIMLHFGDGKVREDSGLEIATYPQNGNWVKVDIILSTELKQFDVYINGEKANSTARTFFKTDSDPMDVSRICFDINRSIDIITTRYIDDIKLSLLSEPTDEPTPDIPDEGAVFSSGQHVYDFMDFETATSKDLGRPVEGWDNWTLSTILVEPTLSSTIIVEPGDLSGDSYMDRNNLLQLHRLEKNTTTNEWVWYVLKDGLYTRKVTGRLNLTFRVKPVNFPSGSFNFGLRNSFSNSVQLGEYMFRIDVNSAGDIYYSTENGDTLLAEKAFPKTGWSDVRLEVDTDERVGWLYVNGERIGEPLRYYVLGTEEKWNHISIVQFDISRFSRDQSKIYFDDIAVWKDCSAEIQSAAERLTWESISEDSIDSVEHNLSLPETVGDGYSVLWKSSDEGVITSDGRITRRSYTQNVTLTADVVYDAEANVYQHAYAQKKFNITIPPKMDVSADDIVNDIADIYLTDDKITDEPLSAITKDLTLPASGPDGVTISWSTEGEDSFYVTNDGTVTRPEYSQGDQEVVLKATISLDDGNGSTVQAEKEFTLTVKRKLSDQEKVDAAKEALIWNMMSYELQDEPITQNLALPTKGLHDVDISWETSDQRVMTRGGILKRKEENKAITLTATFSYGEATTTKLFDVVVKMSPEAMAQADASDIVIQNADAITDNFTLPLIGKNYGLTIKWSSSNTTYAKVKNGGNIVITRPEYTDGDKSVTLTGKFLVEGGSVLITFPITVKALPSDADMVQSVYDALTWESISLDNKDSVYRNLSLITDFGGGVSCVWRSTNENVLLPTGEVINPSVGSADGQVTLTARIQKRDEYLEKTFENITVRAFTSEEEKLQKAVTALTFSSFHDEPINKVTKDISLPTLWKYGTSISWSSSGTGATVINSNARVSRADFGKGDKTAQLKAIITDGSITREKVFYITVKEAAEYENLFIHDYEWADIGTYEFKKENDSNEWSFPDVTNVDMLIEQDPLQSSNQVFMIRRRAGLSPTGNGQMYFRNEQGQLGELTMSGRFFMNDVCNTYLYAEGLTGTGSQIQIFFNTDGTVKFVGALDEETQSVTVTKDSYYSRGEWVNFRIEMNTESQRYHVFIIKNDGTEVCITANGMLVNEEDGTDFDSTKGIGFIYTFDKTRTRDIKGYRFTLESATVAEDSIICMDDLRIDYRESHSETLTEAAINFEKALLGTTDLSNVTEDIVFPVSSMGESIKIRSSNPEVLDNNGKVTPKEQDQKVTLTVEFLYDDRTLVKTYEVVVKNLLAAIKTDAEAVAADLNNAITALNNVNLNSVTEDLPFVQGKYGCTISYSSDNNQVIAADGTVTRPQDDTPVMITVTVTKNSESANQTITVIVKGSGKEKDDTQGSRPSSSVVYIPSTGSGASGGGSSSVIATMPFVDVPKEHWAYNDILDLYREGCISGKTHDTFSPDEAVKREEFVKMVCEFFNLKNSSQDVSYTDVDKNAWYYKYICSSNYFGISNGMGDGSFGVGRYISRQDAATIIHRVAILKQLELGKQNTTVDFADALDISEYAKEAVSALSSAGVLSGNTNGYFEPNSVATRAQVAKILNSFHLYR